MSGVAPTTPPELLGSRRSRLLGRMRPGGLSVAVLSSVVVFGVIGWLIISSPGWPLVQRSFFDAERFWSVLPDLARALWKNIQLFVIAEVLILVFALGLAVMKSLPGPAFFPLRLIAVVYVDLFRAVPSILVISLLGLGKLGGRPLALADERGDEEGRQRGHADVELRAERSVVDRLLEERL